MTVCALVWTCTRRVCTQHGSVKKVFTATLERASCGNCSRAQKSSVCYFSAGALLSANFVRGEADNHTMIPCNDPAYRKSLVSLAGATSRGDFSLGSPFCQILAMESLSHRRSHPQSTRPVTITTVNLLVARARTRDSDE